MAMAMMMMMIMLMMMMASGLLLLMMLMKMMIMMVRSFGKLKNEGWRPRRTIIFASWEAEEYGLEGSYEGVYQHLTKVMHRTVGMVNTDICVSGPVVKPQSSP